MSFLLKSVSRLRCLNISGALYTPGIRLCTSGKDGEGKKSKMQDDDLLSIIKKIPVKPKNARSASSIYVDQRVNELIKDHPDTKLADLKKIAKDEWEKLEMKQPYEEQATMEMKEYKNLKDAYDAYVKQTVTVKEMVKIIGLMEKYKAGRKKDVNKIKASLPSNGYKLFMKEYTETQRTTYGVAPNLSEIGKVYQALTPEEKKRYDQRAEENKAKVEEAIKHYEKEQL